MNKEAPEDSEKPKVEWEITELADRIGEYRARHKDALPAGMSDDVHYALAAADAKTDREATKKELQELWDRLTREEPIN